jgi:V/A-type H+-transporting ATPase subunit E
MATLKKGLIAIANEILEDVKIESEKIIRNSEDKAENILSEAKKEAESRRDLLLNEAKKKSVLEKKKMKSLTIMEIRNKQLNVKENYINDVFEQAFNRLKKFTESENYSNWLLESIENVIKNFGSDQPVVYVNSKDYKFLKNGNFDDKLSKKLKIKITIATENLGILGGFIVHTSDRKLLQNNTFENRLQTIKSDLRSKIAKILFQMEA